MDSKSPFDADVIIVGAGLSGMSAAKQLTDAGKKVLLFDGKDRVGGRTWCDPEYENGSIDFGGMFVGTTHAASTRLGKEMGLELVKARPEGMACWDLGTEVLHVDEGYPEKTLSSGASLSDGLTDAFKKIDAIAAQVGKDEPWNAEGAAELDGLTMQSWLDENIEDPLVRFIVGSDVSIITG
ncbi:MAG: hypothetical protein CMK07_16705, partial [Ponticaulis sp.]|nr:hypothetical protein [Ponticaulis sp.]